MSDAAAQAQWVAWIWGRPCAAPPASLRPVGSQPLERGLSAYREHAKALAVRALGARFPLLCEWLGDADFAGLAWAYARQHPPRQGNLNGWGDGLSAFLQAVPDMDAEPPVLAAIDDALHRLATAADDPPADAQLWAQLAERDPATVRLRWSAHLQCMALPQPLTDLLEPGNEPLDPPSEHLLLWRRGWKPCRGWLAPEQAHWLNLQGRSASLAEALEQQLAAHPAFDLGAALARAWQQGWLLGLDETRDAGGA